MIIGDRLRALREERFSPKATSKNAGLLRCYISRSLDGTHLCQPRPTIEV